MQFTDEQQKYIDAHYQLLPLDADGAPIHMGDSVEGELLDDSTVSGTVCAFHLYDDEPDSVYIKVSVQKGWTIKELRLTSCRHVKPDPLKELLEELVSEARDDSRDFSVEPWCDAVRELMGGDA